MWVVVGVRFWGRDWSEFAGDRQRGFRGVSGRVGDADSERVWRRVGDADSEGVVGCWRRIGVGWGEDGRSDKKLFEK
jgi:hypothetical protein